MSAPLEAARPATDAAALARVRAGLARELAAPRGPTWQQHRLRGLAGAAVTTSLLVIGTFLAGIWNDPSFATGLLHAALPVGALLGLQALAVHAAFAPRATGLQRVAVGGAVLALGLLIALRGEGHPSALPEWVCTLSHLGTGLVPLAVLLSAMRAAALSQWRLAAAGVVSGSFGALLGEFACGQGALHVALFHGGAWLLALLLAQAVGRFLRPTSFAP